MRAHYRCRRDLRLSGNSLQSQEGFTSGRPSLVDSPPAILHRGAHTADLPRSRTRPTRPAPPTLKAVVIGSCGVALLLGACAIANTPQQDLAYTRWAKCNSTSGTLERIDLDGRITFRYTTAGERQEIVQCLDEASRTGPPLPEPGLSPSGRAVIALDGSTRRGECGVGGAEKLLFRLHDEADPVRPSETRRLLDARTPTPRSIWGGDDTCAIRVCRRPA
jgi:hypothetical protein